MKNQNEAEAKVSLGLEKNKQRFCLIIVNSNAEYNVVVT